MGQDIINPACWFDYERQAWVQNGRYQDCGHPADMDCQCYGRKHAGELASDTQRIRDEMKALEYFGMDEETYRQTWGKLEEWLDRHPLPTSGGGYRVVPVGEFMMMSATPTAVDFKHRQTRNYVHLARRELDAATWSRTTRRVELATIAPWECFTEVGATFDDPRQREERS
jgi:hypothetical protein